jgi:hypothetical protein
LPAKKLEGVCDAAPTRQACAKSGEVEVEAEGNNTKAEVGSEEKAACTTSRDAPARMRGKRAREAGRRILNNLPKAPSVNQAWSLIDSNETPIF